MKGSLYWLQKRLKTADHNWIFWLLWFKVSSHQSPKWGRLPLVGEIPWLLQTASIPISVMTAFGHKEAKNNDYCNVLSPKSALVGAGVAVTGHENALMKPGKCAVWPGLKWRAHAAVHSSVSPWLVVTIRLSITGTRMNPGAECLTMRVTGRDQGGRPWNHSHGQPQRRHLPHISQLLSLTHFDSLAESSTCHN